MTPLAGDGGKLEISQQQHVPAELIARQPLRVQTLISGGGGGSWRRVTDWKFCERKAMEFESAPGQERFPLRISQITGYDGPRCDILSFATQTDRDLFLNGKHRHLQRVARFIEVKGRSDRSALIALKGNELSAAEEYRSRFYLYRLYEEAVDRFLLAILADPLSEKNALEAVVHVSMERAQSTQRFTLSGGLTTVGSETTASAGVDGSQIADENE